MLCIKGGDMTENDKRAIVNKLNIVVTRVSDDYENLWVSQLKALDEKVEELFKIVCKRGK